MKVVMGGIGTGGTGAPPSAIKLEGRIGGTGGTGAPPSATNVLMNELCGTGGTGAPPSAVRLEFGIGGGTGGTGAPPSATSVLSCLKCGTGGTGAPPSATGRWIGTARDCPSCRGWFVEDTDGATRTIDANAARTKLLSF